MASGFRVDLGALEQAAAGVNGTLDVVGQRSVSSIPHDPAALGHPGLAATLSDFLDRWQLGVGNLIKDGQEIAARLAENVDAYRRVESNTHDELTGMLGGSGADPGVA